MKAKQPPQITRWDAEFSPLKISFWAGSGDAPEELKQEVRKDPESARVEPCVRLRWQDALWVLTKAGLRDFEFHPKDYDWQVNGWRLAQRELLPIGSLTSNDMQKWPHLPANPTTADFGVEVMNQYLTDIEQMEYSVCLERAMHAGLSRKKAEAAAKEASETVYKTLKADFDAWTYPAINSLPHPNRKVMRCDGRQLLKRAFEIMATGDSEINPLTEAPEISPTAFEHAIKNGLVPFRAVPCIDPTDARN